MLENYMPTRFMAATSHYDKEKADRAVKFIECLKHSKGQWAGQQFKLLEWQERLVRDIFGTIKPNGYRQFTQAYVEVPKKNGKSALSSTLALYLLCADGEEGAEIYSCAGDRQQASIVYNEAVEMVKQCPALAKRMKILASTKRLVYLPTNSYYQVLSAETGTKHGFSAHGVIFDELHVQKTREFFDIMTKGSGDARRQPLFFYITTAGNNTHSICYEVHQKAMDIIEGRKVDPTFFPLIYGAKEEEDWTSPEVWAKANPSLGVTVGLDKVQDACRSAQNNPAEENAFRQLRLNQWTRQESRWLSMLKINACKVDFTAEDLEGRICYGGLDLSSTTDLTAFVLVFPPESEDDYYYILPYFWLPDETIDLRSTRDKVPYDIWRRQGILNVTEGNVVDYGAIREFIGKLGERYQIAEIAFDLWNARHLVQELEDDFGFTMVQFGQGFRSLSTPTKELERLILERKLAHNGHPIWLWNFDNLVVERDAAGNIKPSKSKATEKIDGCVATVMALDRALLNSGGSENVYDSRGLIFI